MSEQSIVGSVCFDSANIFNKMRSLIEKVKLEAISKNEDAQNAQMSTIIEQTKTINSLNQQVLLYKQTLLAQENKLKKMEEEWEKATRQNLNRHRRETKKYIELINEKQSEMETQKKNNTSLSNRISTMTYEIEALTNGKITLEETVGKSIEALKSQIKECNFNIDQNDLDKMVLENKYKQICEKVEQVVNQWQESETRRKQIENKYQNLKISNQELNNECMELKFTVQKYRLGYIDPAISNKSHVNENKQPQNNETIREVSTKASQLLTIFKQIQTSLPGLDSVESLRQLTQELKAENIRLNEKIDSLSVQIEQLRVKQDGCYEDQMLKKRNPSLYDCLLRKKQQIQQFQNKLVMIEQIARKVQEDTGKEQPISLIHIDSLQMRNEELEIKMKELLKQNEQIDYQRRKYKLQLYDMVEMHELNKKKRAARTKKKIRCEFCLLGFESPQDAISCEQCLKKVHLKCQSQHICCEKIERDSICSEITKF